MSPTRRRNRKPSATSPEALAALLPNDLRSLEGLYTPGDYQAMRRQVVDWLNHAAPGHDHKLPPAVMNAAGCSAADYYRHALSMPVGIYEWAAPPPPVIEKPYEPTQEDLDLQAARAERLRRSQKRVFVTR
ncbi:hypothetical protein RHA1_ro06563 [Rhodococcus jostii RHA1]|uniref:Uncharacterized protein n=2 Tax=Rhodococcus jostii TaxID=132919 RepID=Q0S2A0_RHOJR|nr:hypothetical protein RHA1_ro06563 [Rhodococcus jostii RHA1]